jgi:hypothetical protein
MAYREDLGAAQARITALESELEAARRENRRPLRCGRCLAPIEVEHLDREQGLVRCGGCERRVTLGLGAVKPAPKPEDFEVSDTPDRLRIEWRWSGAGAGWILVLACGAAAVPMLAFKAIGLVLLLLLLMLGFLYWTRAMARNRTVVEVSKGALAVRRGPVYVGADVEIRRAEIEQVYCTLVGNRYGPTYRVWTLLRGGRRRLLVRGLTDPARALYLEKQIERRLMIADVPVPGELPRH